jgi:cell division protein FtsN
VVKRVDLGEKGVYYRAFAGPFSSVDQATQVCSNLKAAGGPQCIIQRN